MTIREWVNRNSAVVMIVVILVLLAALWIIIRSSGGERGPTPPPPQWFYCLGTEQLFADRAGLNPPIKSPWGYEAVAAQVYFCGGCDGEPRIGYLHKYRQDVKQLLDAQQQQLSKDAENAQLVPTMTVAMGALVSRPDPINWVQKQSTPGYKLVAEAFVCDEGQHPNTQCHPEQVTTVEP